MLTTILVTSSPALSTRVLAGCSSLGQPCERGLRLDVPPDTLVVYAVFGRRVRGYVFRTLERPEPGATVLVGVWPQVRLLVELEGRSRLLRLQRALSGLSLQRLSDGAVMSLHGCLGRRREPDARLLAHALE